jgi:hypothetical protein
LLSPSKWQVVHFGQVAGLGQTARVQRASSFSLLIPVAGSLLGRGQDCLELRASSDHCFIVGALRAHETVLPLYLLPSFCLPESGLCDLTGGADLGARPPAAGSLHRAGCEDGRAGQRQDPSVHTGQVSSFHAISQNIHSYRELITNASSIRRFSSLPADLAHWSTFFLIQRCTSANSGEA